MSRNKLITFCYLFIVGIGLAMAFPVGPEALGPLWTATAALGLLTIAGFVAAHRLRKRYREILREEIGDTVSSPEEIEEEIRHLFRSLAAP